MDMSAHTIVAEVSGENHLDFHWGREEVYSLINSVEEYFEDFYDGTKKKKAIWNCVAEHMRGKGYNCSGLDCDKKWRNLKGTYTRVLQKQMYGDTSTRFEYFDALHHILGQEIDPLLKEQSMNDDDAPDSPTPSEFNELTNDEGFLWTREEVHLLLDYIVECQEAFASPETAISTVWEDIARQVSQVGEEVSSKQCQRKWLNLLDGFKVHEAQAKATGSVPLWEFYTRTRDVASSVHVRTTFQKERKSKTRIKVEPKTRGSPRKTRLTRSIKGKEGQPRSALARIKHIETAMSVKQRLERLETRMETTRHQRETSKNTNSLLVQVLAELRRINATFRPDEHGPHGVHTKPDTGSGSPNQEFVIVEAYADQA